MTVALLTGNSDPFLLRLAAPSQQSVALVGRFLTLGSKTELGDYIARDCETETSYLYDGGLGC